MIVYINHITWTYIIFLCGLSSNKEIAEDITQETFTKALTAINSHDGRKDIRAWLFTIARNTYFTYCKREKIYVEWEPPTEQVDIQIGVY